jgi:hypothetical protein
MKRIIFDEAYRTVKLNEGDRKISLPMIQAIIRSLAVAAVKGQHQEKCDRSITVLEKFLGEEKLNNGQRQIILNKLDLWRHRKAEIAENYSGLGATSTCEAHWRRTL